MNMLKSVRHQIEEYETQVRPLVRQRLFYLRWSNIINRESNLMCHPYLDNVIFSTIWNIFLFNSESKLFSWKLKENISCIQLVNFANSFFVVAAPSGLPKIIKFSFILYASLIWSNSKMNSIPEIKLKKKSWSRNLFMKVRDSIILACPIWIFHPSLCVALGSSVTYIFELAKVSRKLEDTARA